MVIRAALEIVKLAVVPVPLILFGKVNFDGMNAAHTTIIYYKEKKKKKSHEEANFMTQN